MINFKEFYTVEENPRYLIDKKGNLWDTKAKRFKVWTISKPVVFSGGRTRNIRGGRRITTLSRSNGERYAISQHRLLADAFIEKPDVPHNLVVNHIDGDPSNNDILNLEWCTYSENSQHMYDTGLSLNVSPVEVNNVVTGEVLSFRSVTECARYLNIPTASLSSRLKTQSGKIFSDGYAVRRKNSRVQWSDKLADEWELRAVCVYDIFSNELHTFGSIQSAGRFTGINSGTIGVYLKRNATIPFDGYLFFDPKSADYFKNMSYTDSQLKLFRLHRNKTDQEGWLLVHQDTGEETIHLIKDAALKFNLSISQTRIYLIKGISPCGRYNIEKINCDPN